MIMIQERKKNIVDREERGKIVEVMFLLDEKGFDFVYKWRNLNILFMVIEVYFQKEDLMISFVYMWGKRKIIFSSF